MSALLEPYVHGDLVIDFAQHRATLEGQPLPLVALDYRLLAEVAASSRPGADL